MGVKDLVGIFEDKAQPDTGNLSRRFQRTRSHTTLAADPDTPFASGSSRRTSPSRSTREASPPHRSARFVQHTWLHAPRTEESLEGIPLQAVQHSVVERDLGLVDSELLPDLNVLKRPETHDDNDGSVFSQSSTIMKSNPNEGTLSTSYSASLTAVAKSEEDSTTLISSSAMVQLHPTFDKATSRHVGSHQSVPAAVVFDRHSPPLFIPKLDKYIASLPVPEFAADTKGKGKNVDMFSPMDRLATEKKTLDDLEHNSSIIPAWRDRNTWLGLAINGVLGITGSSALAPFYSVQGLLDTAQIFALILSTIFPHKGSEISSRWKKLFLGTIPNILALNFASTPLQALIYLLVFMCITAGLLFYLFHITNRCSRLHIREGLHDEKVGNVWAIMIVTFVLTAFYLPLSTMALHVVIWSDDLWVVSNPYKNVTTFPTDLPPLGPSEEYRDPLDFCWTTTMKKNEINFAPVVIVCAVLTIASLTVWFPIRLYNAIKYAVPKVDRFTEMGKPRSRSEMNREYQRLLERDKNPFNFLYGGYRRGWAGYQSVMLLTKLTALIITAFMDPNTCLFRSFSRSKIEVARQAVLLVVMSVFFLLQCLFAPFLDPVNNASEWTSRLNYVLTSAVALAVALDIPGKDLWNSVVLYIIYILTYGLSIYFTIVNISIMHRLIKRLTGRVDFSIDIFSPRLDISTSSPHLKRRIWQEAITTLFLTDPSCRIPFGQPMKYAESAKGNHAPYLLNFMGSPSERHVENLKILREIGHLSYSRAIALLYGPDYEWFRFLEETIQTHFLGPDSYWKDPSKLHVPGCSRFFGNAWWIPFPPSVVIRLDDGSLNTLREVCDLQEYVNQNSSGNIRRRREIRLALRALNGKIVTWPYEHIVTTGSYFPCSCRRRGYRATTTIQFEHCVLQIKPRGDLVWEGLQIGSGFEVQLVYSKNVKVGAEVIGLNDDWDLTTPLARFFSINRRLVPQRLEHIEAIMHSYRKYHFEECRAKAYTLSYRFLTYIYDRPRDPTKLAQSSIMYERDPRVRELMLGCEDVLKTTYKRLSAVTGEQVAAWWYIFWDDLWRRNFDTISALRVHAQDFNPHYPSSIAYTPLSRPILEQFLTQRGLFTTKPNWRTIFHPGFLNMIYIRLNDIVFHGTPQAIAIHLGDGRSEWDMGEIDLQTQGRPSTLGTGGGTDHDDVSIRARPKYKWEALMASPVKECIRGGRWIASKIGVWFGLTPLWRRSFTVVGLSLDVRLDEKGRYVALEKVEERNGGKAADDLQHS